MNPIELGKAIDNYGIAVITAIILILIVWLVRYLVKQQTEDRIYYRSLVTNDLKSLHDDGVKNADLNNQSIILIKDMNKDQKEHNGHTRRAFDKTIGALNLICDRLNSNNPAAIAMKKKLKEYKEKGIIINKRKESQPIEVDRRI